MRNQVEIGGKKYPVNFGLYALAEFTKEQGIKTMEELFEAFRGGDLMLMIDLFWKALEAGSAEYGKELELSKSQFRYGCNQAIMDEFTRAFNAQFETQLPENPTKPVRPKKK